MTTKFTSIPIIDIGVTDDPVGRQRIVADLRHVLLNVGFIYVQNHGVSVDVIEDLVETLSHLLQSIQ